MCTRIRERRTVTQSRYKKETRGCYGVYTPETLTRVQPCQRRRYPFPCTFLGIPGSTRLLVLVSEYPTLDHELTSVLISGVRVPDRTRLDPYKPKSKTREGRREPLKVDPSSLPFLGHRVLGPRVAGYSKKTPTTLWRPQVRAVIGLGVPVPLFVHVPGDPLVEQKP